MAMERGARPWDIFNKNIKKVDEKIGDERMAICNACPFLIQATKTCTKCGCFMTAKTKLPHASCPEGKWQAIKISLKEEM